MMSLKSKNELVEAVQARYLKAIMPPVTHPLALAPALRARRSAGEHSGVGGQVCPGVRCQGKNWSEVRPTVGYDRWETEQELALLECLYDDLRLYVNFFQPSLKLIAKERIDYKTRKRYDTAKPFLCKPKHG